MIRSMPRPRTATMPPKPKATPKRCGTVLRMPKFAPDAISIRLFGPGVIEVTKANATRASKMC
ncbi:hypothetical protein D3C76_1448950 [compost metagenome]